MKRRVNGYSSDPHPDQPRGMAFSSALHRLRVQAGISREQLALEAELDTVTLWKLEHGYTKPRLDTAERIARVLSHHLMRHVSLEEFRAAGDKEVV